MSAVGPEDLPWDTTGWWLHKRTRRWHRTVMTLFGTGTSTTACGLTVPEAEVQDYRCGIPNGATPCGHPACAWDYEPR